MVLGIISLILCFIPGTAMVGLIISLLGVILGALGRKSNASCALGGLVCSIIALVFCGIGFFACGGLALCSACAAGL